MEQDTSRNATGKSLAMLSGLDRQPRVIREAESPDAADICAATWHEEEQERQYRQFSMYMNKKRHVLPAKGLLSIMDSPAVQRPGVLIEDGQAGALATLAPRPNTGDTPVFPSYV